MNAADIELMHAACCIAGLDGAVTDGELKLLKRLAERVGVTEISLNALLDRARKDRAFYTQQFSLALGDPRATLRTLLVVAAADGRISTDERVVLEHFAKKLGVSQEQLEELIAELKGQVRARRRLRGETPD